MKIDKQKHLIVGLLMGFASGFAGISGLLAGWVIIIGWEVQQALFDTGTPEIADILYGIVPFTSIWLILFIFNKEKKEI